MTDFTRLERKGYILELLLHLPRPEEPPVQSNQPLFPLFNWIKTENRQVSFLSGAAAV